MRDTFLAEFLATTFLLAAVVGSGIAAEALNGGSTGLALLANALATGAALYVLILVFGPISGAHMNPVVSLAAAMAKQINPRTLPIYLFGQMAGAICGTLLAHAMFGLPLLQVSNHVRSGTGQWIAEVVATAGLIAVIWGCLRYGRPVLAGAVGTYISAAYWFTSSTSFANPAVTLARTVTDTFAGIRPLDAPAFIAAQVFGLVLVLPLLSILGERRRDDHS